MKRITRREYAQRGLTLKKKPKRLNKNSFRHQHDCAQRKRTGTRDRSSTRSECVGLAFFEHVTFDPPLLGRFHRHDAGG
jgi:hypothetical protein